MTRGKNAAAAARRREAEALEAAKEMRVKMEHHRDEATALRRQLVDQDALRAEIGRLRDQLAEGTTEELRRLQDRNYELLTVVREQQGYVDRIAKIHETLLRRADLFNIENTEGTEEFLALISDTEVRPIAWTRGEQLLAEKLGTDKLREFQRMKGTR